jgi:DNA-directed RNA polymerase specialized sigma24 family protein
MNEGSDKKPSRDVAITITKEASSALDAAQTPLDKPCLVDDIRRSLGWDWASVAAEKHMTQLDAFIYRQVGNREDAKDIRQKTLIKLASVREGQVTEDNLLFMLYRIARWKIAEFREDRAKDFAYLMWTDDVAQLVDTEAAANSELYLTCEWELSQQRWDVMRKIPMVLKTMSPTLAAPFILVVRDGLSYAAAAKRLNTTEHAVKKNIQRARAELRKRLF